MGSEGDKEVFGCGCIFVALVVGGIGVFAMSHQEASGLGGVVLGIIFFVIGLKVLSTRIKKKPIGKTPFMK